MVTERTVKTSLIAQASQYISEMGKAADATRRVSGEQETLAAKSRAFEQVGRAGLAVGALAAAAVTLAVSKFSDFDQAMSNVKAATQETSENMGLLREAALQAGADSVFSATESANAIEELGKAGLSTADILSGALKGSLDLASAGELGIARSAEIAATTLSQFKLEGDQAAHVADVLAAGAGKALGSVDDLANGLKFVGPVAAAMGVSLEETTGVLALFASKGIVGEQAGTSLRGMLSSLTSPSRIAAKEIEDLGITLYDSRGAFLGVENAAGELSRAYGDMTDAERDFSLGLLFGNEQITSARVLLDAGAEGVRRWTDDVNDAGYAAQVAADRLDNLQGDVEQLGGSLETALIGAGSASNDVLRLLAQAATDAVNSFNELDPAAQGAALGIGATVSAAGLGLGTFFTLVPKVAEFNAALKTMGPRAQFAGKMATGLAKGLGAIAAAAAVVTVLDKIGDAGRGAAAGMEEITNALLKKDLDAAFENISAGVNDIDSSLDRLFSSRWDKAFSRFVSDSALPITGLTTDVNQSREAFDTLGQSLADLVNSGATGTAERAFWRIVAAAKEQGVSVTEVMDLLPAYREALSAQETDQLLAADAADKNAEALAVMAQESTRAADELDALTEALKGFNDQQFAADNALFAMKQSFLDIDAVIGAEGFTGTLDLNTEEGIRNSQALRDIASATNEAAGEVLLLTGNQEDANSRLEEGRAKLAEVGEQFGLSGDELQGFIDTYVSSPKDLAYQAMLNGVGSMEQQLTDFVRDWNNKPVTMKFFADTYNLDRAAAASAARWTARALAAGQSSANGNIYSYASGGFGEGTYSGGTPLYKFAEPETRWEAFISGRPGAEGRNREIWKDAGQRLGVSPAVSQTQTVIERVSETVQLVLPDGRVLAETVRDYDRSLK